MAKKQSDPNYLLVYIISAMLVVIIHYLTLARTSLHPTIQLAISLVVFMFVLGFASMALNRLSR